MGKQRNVKKREKMGKNGLVHLHFCCFFDLFFAFVLLLFCIFPFSLEKSKIKAKKSKQKANRKKQKKCKWTSPFVSHFFPFLSFLFSLLFCFCVFWILLICFLVFPFFCIFRAFFKF